MTGVIGTAVLDAWDDLYNYFKDNYGQNSGHSPEYGVLQGASFLGSVQFPCIAIEYTGYVLDSTTKRGIVMSFNLWTLLQGDGVTDREAVKTHCSIVDDANTHMRSENTSPTIETPQHGHVIGQNPFEIEFEGAGFLRIARNQIEVKALICGMD